MTRLLALCRHTARSNDAVNGPGATRADSIAAVIGLFGFAIIAFVLAAIGGA